MSRRPKQFLTAIAACILVGIFLFQITRGTGPLDSARAARLLDTMLQTETNRVEVIAPDGELAKAPASILRNIQVIDCPKISSTTGTLPGRYGGGNRTYGAAAFECLFTGENSSGTVLYFSAYIYRSADPSVRAYNDGHLMEFLKSRETRDLMKKLRQKTHAHNQQEQKKMWAELARDDIYVPADKTQTSPLEQAMQDHIRRLSSQ